MNGKIRRVVTGHDANGKAVIIEDRLAPNVRTNPLRPGHISVELWKTKSMPVPVSSVITEGPLAVVAEPTPAWISIPSMLLVTVLVLVLAAYRTRHMEIRYGSD